MTSAEYHDIVCDHPAKHVLRITLNRPVALNAYTTRLAQELAAAVEAYQRDDDLRVLILTGAGRAFCAGGDILEPEVNAKAAARQLGWAAVLREGFHRAILALFESAKPTIAAINGPAVAGGLALAMACDFRVAATSARLGDTSGNIGYLPDEGGAWFFPRVIGYPAALAMTLLGEVYPADRALELGLVGEVVPDAELEARTLDLAARMAARAPLSVRLAKHLLRQGLGTSLATALEEAQLMGGLINDSEDGKEGVRAFREKRRPEFLGR